MGRISFYIALTAATLVCGRALADGRNFDIEHLQLATGGGDFMATEGAGHLRPWEWRVGIAYRSSDSPLVVDDGVTQTRLIASRSLLDLDGSVELGRYLGIGADLPLAIDGSGGLVQSGAALGDLRLVPRVELLRREHVGLAALLGLRLPTGDTSRFLGEGMVVFEPRLAVQLNFGIVRAGVNAGVRVRQARQYLDLHVGNEIFGSAALAVVPKPWLDLFSEIHADTALSSSFGHSAVTPVEALVGAAGTWKGVRLGAALGIGLVHGYGTSSLRGLITLEYRRPGKTPAPVVPSVVAVAPRPVPAPKPVVAALQAKPEVQAAVAETTPAVEEPATPTEEPEVSIAPGRIELAQPIFFQLNRKRIRLSFRDELKALARVLQRRPELTCIWIEGHADATGPEQWNMTLSRARAEEVAHFLINEGVAPSRLAPVGYGEARPLVPTPHGVPNERNRRVHFYTDAAPTDTPAPTVSRAEQK